MLGPLQSLKQLEVLVKQASAALQKTSAENRQIKDAQGELQSLRSLPLKD